MVKMKLGACECGGQVPAGAGRDQRWVQPHKELPVFVLPQPLWAEVGRLMVLN